ncbi:MAG: [FeFe] hydrogenase H-cluster maturation GTPase HydF [Clostridia bacterium]
MGLNNTPSANRLHIAIFGKQNSGKSTLLNFITNQDIAIVSEQKGATADPVYKAMEIAGVGPCMLIDTAGFDDSGDLGKLRVEKTRVVLDRTDVAIMLVADEDLSHEKEWAEEIKKRNISLISVVNDFEDNDADKLLSLCQKEIAELSIKVNAKKKIGRDAFIELILRNIPEKFEALSITAEHVKENDVVMLVMPQDIGAPKGRLILPQVQTTRDLLDNKCTVISITHDKMEEALSKLKNPPDLIITDSQVFPYVYERTPKESKLTSFSVLFAAYKGDVPSFVDGLKSFTTKFKEETEKEINVLIAEACTHAPQTEDIGRIKIPNILKKQYGDRVKITVVAGADFPKDLAGFDLVIHCGGCMFNRKFMMTRIEKAKAQGVPITNYGIFLANATNILDKIDI